MVGAAQFKTNGRLTTVCVTVVLRKGKKQVELQNNGLATTIKQL